MSQYKVYQWATGVVGKSALRGILRHPKLELAGVKVYSEEKEWLDAAAKAGGVSFLSSGCNPGGIAERFPLTFSGWCNQIDRIQMTECGDCRE